MGMLLAHGESGVAKDPQRALDYFRAAAAGGEAEGFFNIGAAYASGRGAKRNYAEALGWLIVATQRGTQSNAEASLRAQLKSQPAVIAAGEKRAKEIQSQLAGKKVAELLPPAAPLDQVFDPLKPVIPSPARGR
jgi:TPR repeat protein